MEIKWFKKYRPLCCIVNPVASEDTRSYYDGYQTYVKKVYCCEAVNRCADHHAPGCWRRIKWHPVV